MTTPPPLHLESLVDIVNQAGFPPKNDADEFRDLDEALEGIRGMYVKLQKTIDQRVDGFSSVINQGDRALVEWITKFTAIARQINTKESGVNLRYNEITNILRNHRYEPQDNYNHNPTTSEAVVNVVSDAILAMKLGKAPNDFFEQSVSLYEETVEKNGVHSDLRELGRTVS